MNSFPEIINPVRILSASDKISQTPAFVYDETVIIDRLAALSEVRTNSGCKVLYSIKAAPLGGLLQTIIEYVDGFSASSLFECQIAKEIIGGIADNKGTIHITSPGLREEDVKSIANYADYISFNSMNQWQQYKNLVNGKLNCGLRLNPEKSFARDERYDPCRKYSKLGVPVSRVANENLQGIQGIHLHNNCESNDYTELKQTLEHICELLDPELENLQWINLGGGYFIDDAEQLHELEKIIKDLKDKYTLDVFIEPGKGIVGSAGFLVASVVDIFASDGKQIAVLDTTVNHLPEVFEYQYKPHILQEDPEGQYEYRLAGCSCLSGDLFGDYHFQQALEIGSRVTFKNVGAYMLVKASMFNGINLPTVNVLKSDETLLMEREYSYEDFRNKY
ncbi:MAG: carboxynorspermidine decarboxylase [Gammaproteobacteria bacterium]|nr:MAG: carboxynorspermidine decarboxylase [Gammaproteobacteria bacterium]RKZ71057.1 MAG: carboxynorspermidine decarboxylase [Gammaproteobacteria bacterium]